MSTYLLIVFQQKWSRLSPAALNSETPTFHKKLRLDAMQTYRLDRRPVKYIIFIKYSSLERQKSTNIWSAWNVYLYERQVYSIYPETGLTHMNMMLQEKNSKWKAIRFPLISSFQITTEYCSSPNLWHLFYLYAKRSAQRLQSLQMPKKSIILFIDK